jgi:hypothetical protein
MYAGPRIATLGITSSPLRAGPPVHTLGRTLMTAYPAGGPYGNPAPARPAAVAVRRPRLLTVVVGAALLVAVLHLVTAAIGFVSGRAAVQAELESGLDPVAKKLAGTLAAAAVDSAYDTIKARAVVLAVLAVVVAVLALASLRKASMVARICLVVALFVAVGASALAAGDVYPEAGVVTAGLAIVLSLPVAVVLFLPPVNRYRTAGRAPQPAAQPAYAAPTYPQGYQGQSYPQGYQQGYQQGYGQSPQQGYQQAPQHGFGQGHQEFHQHAPQPNYPQSFAQHYPPTYPPAR